MSDVNTLILNRDSSIKESELRKANSFIINNLGKILRDDENFYSGLKKSKQKKLDQEIYRFEGQPYLIEREGHWLARLKQKLIVKRSIMGFRCSFHVQRS
ncbi:hypothetical protein Aazo_3567 ['Nostoc azollae' 0708]|uniref:Uncharacterized protein n=1 Tax=Nostoc azollae (strain 0708) TaxID=551115 RepID=D7E3J1_NOSA0|nr:hypothetical protein Aazo_3567 ['Nostoc azollae' 0708]